MSIGERIKAKRLDLKLTQQSLSRELSITPQHISAIEQNKRLPSLGMLERLAEELGVTIDYLVTGRVSILDSLLPAVKADPRLSLKARRALVCIIEELYDKACSSDRLKIRKITRELPVPSTAASRPG
jgi:transcriptional regulator with XRE-family HTH domain